MVLGQYAGYRDLDDVADDSDVETFASLALTIDDDRWRGRADLAPHRQATRRGPDRGRSSTCGNTSPHHTGHGNRIRFSVKPDASVSFDLDVIDTTNHSTRPTTVVACGPERHGELGDYAVMFDNAMRGDDAALRADRRRSSRHGGSWHRCSTATSRFTSTNPVRAGPPLSPFDG